MFQKFNVIETWLGFFGGFFVGGGGGGRLQVMHNCFIYNTRFLNFLNKGFGMK